VSGGLEQRDRHAVAVVGTRRPSLYGREAAGRLSHGAAAAGLVIVSGLAAGIDTAAHVGALKAGGRTLAVLGSALDCIYPAANAGLARDIVQHGAVLSELPLGRQPDKTTFPMRNRIVSGLSMGVLVVEAGMKSGAMITANQALEQGRAVFAVPGRIDSSRSAGCHELIKSGARLVTGVDDVLAEFEFLLPRATRARTAAAAGAYHISAEEERLLGVLEDGGKDVDSLIRLTGLRASSVSAMLIGLEMKKMVRMLPGRMVERVRAYSS
jgi:DNA processing protein